MTCSPARSVLLTICALTSVLCCPVRAAEFSDAKKAAGREISAADRAEKVFWKDTYSNEKRLAHETYEAEWLKNWGLPTGAKEVHYDFTGYRGLYDQYHEINKQRADAFSTLGGFGKDGMKLLYKYYEHYVGDAAGVEKKLRGARPVQSFNIFDQKLGMQLTCIDHTLGAILNAMARTGGDDAVAYLVEQYSKAEKSDRKMHDVRMRDGILRTLARLGAPEARVLAGTALGDPGIPMRIVAIEALGRMQESDDTRQIVLDHLRKEDKLPVSRAALSLWRDGTWTNSKAIPALIELFGTETDGRAGALRMDYLQTLIELTGIDQGLNPANWAGWLGNNETAIRDGSYEKPKPPEPEEGEDDEGKTEEADKEEEPTESEKDIAGDATVSFFDVKSLSKAVVFLVDASDTLMLPADIEIAKTKAYWEWRTGNKRQMEGIKTQLDRLIEECEKTMSSLHPTCKFNVVLMMDGYRKLRFQPKLVEATDASKKQAIAFLKAARPNGWASQLSGLRDAMELGGMTAEVNEFADSSLDTVFLLSDGVPCGGWWMDAREVVRSFERYNRFRRLTVHCIRIANETPDDAETLMEGIANVSGGSYVWLKE